MKTRESEVDLQIGNLTNTRFCGLLTAWKSTILKNACDSEAYLQSGNRLFLTKTRDSEAYYIYMHIYGIRQFLTKSRDSEAYSFLGGLITISDENVGISGSGFVINVDATNHTR